MRSYLETLKKVKHDDPQLSDRALQKEQGDDHQPSDKSKVALKKDQGAATKSGSTLKNFPTTLKRGAKSLSQGAATLKKDLPERKKLKKTLSDVSVDSWGIPKELASPCRPSETSPPRIWKRKKVGPKQRTEEVLEDEGHPKLQEAMGFKKPAASLKKASTRKRATSSSLKKDHTLKKDSRKAWIKIRKTIAKNPARSYLAGTHQELEKAKLIVEVSQKKANIIPGSLTRSGKLC